MRAIIGMAILAALYALYVFIRPRHECAGSCGSCRTPCHDVTHSEELDHEYHD
jgi:hypothetical protein